MKRTNNKNQRTNFVRRKNNTKQRGQLKENGIRIPLKSVIPVYANSALGTGLYSFVSGVDTRYITFDAIVNNAPSPFSDFLNLYSEMRIVSLSITVMPIRSNTFTGGYSSLSMTVNPDLTSSSNPSNSTVLETPSAFNFDYYAVSPKTHVYTFSGVGLGGNVWFSTSANPLGSVYIGNMVTANFTDMGVVVWEVAFRMNVEFRRLKTN